MSELLYQYHLPVRRQSNDIDTADGVNDEEIVCCAGSG